MKVQSGLVYAVGIAAVLIFVLYLGFMTHYYVLFYDGTDEMYEFYIQLQVVNKDAFDIALQIVVLTVILLAFELHKYRPGLLGMIFVLGMTVYLSLTTFPLFDVLSRYKNEYLAFDFTSMDEYAPSTLAFDIGLIFHYAQIGLLIALCVVAGITFVQRLQEGNPLIRMRT
jgi:hypothetical protein